MNTFFKSWKTTLTGLAVMGFGAKLLLSGQTELGSTLVTIGIGLISAKDFNKTHK